MRTASGAVRTVLLGLLGALIVAGVVVWLLIPAAGDYRLRTPGTEAAGAAPQRLDGTVPAAKEQAETRAITPAPFAESEPAEAAAQKGILEIEVIGPAGRPAAGARLVLVREAKALGSAVTNAQGFGSFAAGSGEAELFVIPDGAPTHTQSVSIEPGRRRIELPAGVAITGRIEVAGGAPSGPIELWPNADDMPSIGPAIFRALNGDIFPRCRTSPSGVFELAGVRPGSTWRFGPRGVGYRLDGIVVGDRLVRSVEAPATGVVIRLTRLPIVRGRAVVAGRRIPLPGAVCEASFSGPNTDTTRWIAADGGGAFAFSAANEWDENSRVTRIELIVRDAKRVSGKTVVLDPAPERDVDLGDIEVPEGRQIRFVVRDQAGAPIEGAVACGGSPVDPATRTDPQGLGTILVASDAATFRVGALRYEVAEVAIPAELPGLLPVVLHPGTGLEIRVAAAAGGAAAPSFQVRISATSRNPFTGSLKDPDPIFAAAGATARQRGTFSVDNASFTYNVPADGPVLVAGLAPGVPLTVEALDMSGQVLASAIVTLAPSEWKQVELRVTRGLRSIRGRVRNVEGAPVIAASVIVDSDPERIGWRQLTHVPEQNTALTDHGGRFKVSGFFERVVHVAVDGSGYTRLVRRDLPVPAEDVELEFVMRAGIGMMVKVLDAGGSPIRDLTVSAETQEFRGIAREEAAGSYALSHLPADGPITIKVWWAWQEWSRAVAPVDGHVEVFKMPAAGKVLVSYAAIGEGPYFFRLDGPGEKDSPRSWLLEARIAEAERTFEAAPVLPGEYEAMLRTFDVNVVVARPQKVIVRPGETTRVTFEKP